MKVFISQPMKGKSFEEIKKEKRRIKNSLAGKYKKPITLIDQFINVTFIDSQPTTIPLTDEGFERVALFRLGRSIANMAEADLVVMAKGWQNARGCRLEYEAAKAYKKPILVL